MKLYKLSLLALALAGTMVACSDDDYNAPAATPGAFFPVDSPDMVELPFDGNTVEITVRRNTPNIPSDETFKLSIDDPSGLFDIPTTVTFTGHEVLALLPVTFDPAKIETDVEYPVTITIDGQANQWGLTTYKFVFDRKTPYEVTKIGVGQFIYNGLLTGGGLYNCVKTVDPNQPNLEIYTIENWFDYPTEAEAVDLKMIVHKDIILENGYPYVEVPITTLGFTMDDADELKVSGYVEFVSWRYEVPFDDIVNTYHFNLVTTTGTVILSPDMVSYFDTDHGVFNIDNRYNAFVGGEYDGGWAAKFEYFYLPGYPDYDIELNYLGYFTNADDEITAMGELYAGEDVETVDVYNVAGDDVEAAIESILNGELEGETINIDTDDAISVKFSVPSAGTYTMIAIANGDGEAQGFDYATYTIAGSAPVAGNWKSIGEGVYVDSWVMPMFTINGQQINPFNYAYKVEIEQNLDEAGTYRLVNPYGEASPLFNNNENKKATNVTFNIADPDFPYVPFQFSGFSDGEKFYIADANWYVVNVGGATPEQALNNPNIVDLLSYYEESTKILEIPYPTFALSSSNHFTDDPADLGKVWKGNYPAQVYFPGANMAQAAAKIIRYATSNDNFVIGAKAANGTLKVDRKSKRTQAPTLKNVEARKLDLMQLR